MNTTISAMERVSKVTKAIESKKLEIQKRREVVETTMATASAKKKEEIKIEAIDGKISTKVSSMNKTIEYYRGEIEKAERKATTEIEILEAKFEAAKRKIEEKFESYREYCQKAIQLEESKVSMITDPLEKKKEALQLIMNKSEDDDKILVRLKVELKQLEEEEVAATAAMNRAFAEHEERNRRYQQERAREEMEHIRRIEMESMERDKALYFAQKQQQHKEEMEIKERNAARREAEAKVKEIKDKEKEERKSVYDRFKKSIYPNLSAEATSIYNYIKTVDMFDLHKDAHFRETVEEAEDFIMSFQTDYKQLKEFESSGYNRMLKMEQDLYDLLGFYDRLKAIRIKDKAKRQEFLIKMNKVESESEQEM